MGKKKNKKKGNDNTPGFEVDDSGQMHFAQNIGEARDSYNTNRDQLAKDKDAVAKIQKRIDETKEVKKGFDDSAWEAELKGDKEYAKINRQNSKDATAFINTLNEDKGNAQAKVDAQQKKTDFAAAAIRMDGTFNPEGQQIYLDAEKARKEEQDAWNDWQATRKPLQNENAKVQRLEDQKADLWQKHCEASRAGDQEKADEYYNQWKDKDEELSDAKADQAKALDNYKEKKATLSEKTEARKEAEKKERASHRSQPKQQSQPADDKGKWYSTKNEDKPKKDNRPNDWVY